ncbi:uncharacterized protein LOC132194428 [Neocloeon triangulifer]|uniref:uncharacterized protein LOC132194428 n=1 Tax=Neocloeon triangulifer TaxID=2078957 RepID=UPI00286F9D11|nr:uncharacterized protein LOC132194428 [Neocloeon triangulifer]
MAPAKFTYFNVTGLGETIRYLLSYGGVEFEDVRVTGETFATMKEKLPLGQLPILEFEGKTLFQSISIARFLANRFNLAGKDEWDKGTCDVAVDTIMDLRNALHGFAYEKDEAVKKQKRGDAITKANYLVGKLEGFLAKNGGHFLKDEQLSWADIHLAAFAGYLNHMAGEDLFSAAPKIKALKAKIDALPAISKYLEKRPAVSFNVLEANSNFAKSRQLIESHVYFPKMAPTKLIYFDVTALGEPIRYILHYSGTEFEDERLTSEQFAPRKPTFPFGKLPVLEIDGKTLHQSVAICRYLAKKAGLAGKDESDALQCDIIVDTIGDMRTAMAGFHYEANEEAKVAKKELALNTTVPYYLEKFETILKENGGYFVNGQLTWVDFWFAGLVDYLNYMAGTDILASSPGLQALKAKVEDLPAIKKYLASRPAVRF